MNDVAGVPDDRAAYAGFWRRFAAYAIDYLVILIGSAVLGGIAPLIGIAGEPSTLSLTVLAGYFLYCTLLESSAWQATLGKRALRLKVMNRRGERIGFARAVVRFVAKLLSVLTLCLGYLLIVATHRRQALHDLVAGTLVAHDGTAPRPTWVVATLATVGCVPVVGALAAIALPAYRDYTIRAQVTEGLALASTYRAAVEAAWSNSQRELTELTADAVGARLPQSGRYVESIELISGMIVITYGGAANDMLAGSVLAIVPALDSRRTLGWACGYGQPPAGFEPVLEGHAGYTDIDERFVPSLCRSTEL